MRFVRTIQRIGWRVLVSVLLLMALAGVAWAQDDFKLGRYTTEHSGAAATGNGYTLVGATGQMDAGGMSGNGFVLVGGFLTGAPLDEVPESKSEIFLPRLGR
jgi:hypothetical protein